VRHSPVRLYDARRGLLNFVEGIVDHRVLQVRHVVGRLGPVAEATAVAGEPVSA
jgi:uncharacterized membrane protein